MSFVTMSPAPFNSDPTFFLEFLLLLADMPTETILVVLYIPVTFNSR